MPCPCAATNTRSNSRSSATNPSPAVDCVLCEESTRARTVRSPSSALNYCSFGALPPNFSMVSPSSPTNEVTSSGSMLKSSVTVSRRSFSPVFREYRSLSEHVPVAVYVEVGNCSFKHDVIRGHELSLQNRRSRKRQMLSQELARADGGDGGSGVKHGQQRVRHDQTCSLRHPT